MEQELRELGIFVPGKKRDTESDDGSSTLRNQYAIGQEERSRNAIYLHRWFAELEDDPALTDFAPRLDDHLRYRLIERFGGDTADLAGVSIYYKDDRLYAHSTVRFHFTTYDIRRDQDTVNPGTDKRYIFVSLGSGSFGACAYAQVLGIFHVQVEGDALPSGVESECFDFLWVRWFKHLESTEPTSTPSCRLDALQFIPGNSADAFGFVDPSHVIRGAHIIPAYQDGRTTELLAPSIARDKDGDFNYYYVNRFVDRDMFVRNIGVGVGHVPGTHLTSIPNYDLDMEDILDDPECPSEAPETGNRDAESLDASEDDGLEPEDAEDGDDDDGIQDFEDIQDDYADL
ncbi:hypothetical protein GLOTRDRAFT_139911 [Gloeophyllum trabeum ATCC 11539]|uniref:Uncharacterized protein n=1 Tax=Gloeophyllum trabeum (strain ATCC 11539 / FP-39264 / Madison 617) TaxID=670483 RepID=S7Q2T1_GLOTA|nr:uncharacterized protein GLOTRDRAFT_139911 [Gloeophyllum trabeum ATCC 11539]EPQ53857.1 hypothetical protein GLOTRDRAFT_139911 [Gloeophyllum trabeum ATCC 11539]